MMKIEFPAEPVWAPLQIVVNDRCREFMFMGQTKTDSGLVFLYKHVWTRRYLNLDDKGRSYRYTGEGYEPIPLEQATKHVFS